MLQEGTLFDNRYELTRLIGRGGFAVGMSFSMGKWL